MRNWEAYSDKGRGLRTELFRILELSDIVRFKMKESKLTLAYITVSPDDGPSLS